MTIDVQCLTEFLLLSPMSYRFLSHLSNSCS